MDYVFASSIVGLGLRMLTISYDVGCQWWTRFNTVRRQRLPPHLQILPPWIRALVPKFHLQSHRESCHSPFSFNYATGCARTDGEGVERNWAELNGQAASTAEMLPGHRWETLDDCCGWANWRKSMGLGAFNLTTRLRMLIIYTLLQATCSSNGFCWPSPKLLGHPTTSGGLTLAYEWKTLQKWR